MNASVVCETGEKIACDVTAFKLGFNPYISVAGLIIVFIAGYVALRMVKIYLDLYEIDIKGELT